MATYDPRLKYLKEDSIAITALFHDLCKANCYHESFRNVKNEETGRWERVPAYSFQAQLPMGHGEKSLCLLLAGGVRLSSEEMLAIRWHMGAYDDAVKGGNRDFNEAQKASKLVLALHTADAQASNWDESE